MQLDRDAEEARAALVLADGDHGAAERRAQQKRHDADGERKAEQDEVIERIGVATGYRWWQSRDRAAGGRSRANRRRRRSASSIGRRCNRTPGRRRSSPWRNRRRGGARSARPGARRRCRRAACPQSSASGVLGARNLSVKAGAIGAEPEIGGMAERQDAGKAQQEIDRHRRQPEHQHARAQRGVAAERRHPEGREQQRRPDRGERDQRARVRCSPLMSACLPRRAGRAAGPAAPAAISTYMTASLAGGQEYRGDARRDADQQAAEQRPVRLPTPPTMMAMKLGMSRPSPIVGSSPSWPPASTPLSPARKMPTREIERAQHAHIDAERRHGLQIERAGADANAQPRIAQQHEQQRHRRPPPSPTMNRR